MKIPHKAMILVCDGKRAMLYRNRGRIFEPELETLWTRAQDNPPTREQGTDRPGRYNDPTGQRSAVDNTDWHQQAEDRFAAEIAAGINDMAASGDLGALVLVAPPRTLGVLRKALDDGAASRIVAEQAKDLTNHPPAEVARILAGSE